MKIALVHDYLFDHGGAENVLEVFMDLFPEAPIYTSVYCPSLVGDSFRSREIRTSFLQHVVRSKRVGRAIMPVYPLAFHSMKLRRYDVVLSSASGFAKGIDVGEARHICYCYSPPRFIWQIDRYVGPDVGRLVRVGAEALTGPLRYLDRRDAANVSTFLAISGLVQRRILRDYGRESDIVYPPVRVDEFHVSDTIDPYFLVVSRLLQYKRIDIVVQAFRQLGLPLVIVGDGPDRRRLQATAGPAVMFAGHLPRADVRQYLSRCRALIVPGEEDFGLAPLEAQASGRPVVAFRGGGSLETITEGVTGWFFDEPNAYSLAALIGRIQPRAIDEIDTRVLVAHARAFDVSVFREKIAALVCGR